MTSYRDAGISGINLPMTGRQIRTHTATVRLGALQIRVSEQGMWKINPESQQGQIY